MDDSLFLDDIHPHHLGNTTFIDISGFDSGTTLSEQIYKTLIGSLFFQLNETTDDTNILSYLFEIDLRKAKYIVEEILSKSLAFYPQKRIDLDTEKVNKTCKSFFSCFDEGTHYYSNCQWGDHVDHKDGQESTFNNWYPLTQATFDTGIIAINDRKIGTLWVQEED